MTSPRSPAQPRSRQGIGLPPTKGAHFHFASGFNKPLDSRTCWTPWSVFQDGSGGLPIPLTWREASRCSHKLHPPLLPHSDRRSNPLSTHKGHHPNRRSRLPVLQGPRGPNSGSPRLVLEGELSLLAKTKRPRVPGQLTRTPGPYLSTLPAANSLCQQPESPLSTFTVPPVSASNGFTSS